MSFLPTAQNSHIAYNLHIFSVTAIDGSARCEKRLVSTDVTGLIVIWDMRKRTMLHKLAGHTSGVKNLAMLHNDTLISGSYDGTIRTWDAISGKAKGVCELSDRGERARYYKDHVFKECVSAMLVLDDGSIISGGISGFVRVWESSW